MLKTEVNKRNTYLYGGGMNINGTEKRNAICVFAVVDKNYNMYVSNNEDGTLRPIADIAEHNERMMLMSEGCEFNLDATSFKAQGNKGFPWKFCRVYTDKNQPLDKTKIKPQYVKFYEYAQLNETLRAHETYSKENITVVASSKLLSILAPIVDKVFITRLNDYEIPAGYSAFDAFPFEIYKKHFSKKTVQYSEFAQTNKKLNSGLAPSDVEITMLSEHIRSVKRLKTPKKGPGSIYDYQFETYSK